MNLINVQHPFFKPKWRRVALVALCLGWGAFELYHQAAFWMFMFWGIGGYCAYEFFFNFDPDNTGVKNAGNRDD